MIIGVPKERKDREARVGVTPAGAKSLREAGHTVLVETGAGEESGFSDDAYQRAGAEVVGDAAYVWGKAAMVVKVKEPIAPEYVYFREGLVLFTYLHLAPLRELTDKLLETKMIAIAYETVRDPRGGLPLLMPMSEIAGRMSVQVGACYLERERGGRGILLGGVPGVPPAHVAILGGGIVGTNAGELISELALAIETGCDAADIGLTVHPHPTLSETVAGAADAFEGTLTDLFIPRK